MIAALFIVGIAAAAVGLRIFSNKKLRVRYGEAHAAYNAAAFSEILEPCADDRFLYVTRLAEEIESTKGVKALAVATFERGLAIHQIHKDGTFAKKGPYFIRWNSRNWRRTGVVHLVKVFRGTRGFGFAPDHYNQRGVIREKGVAILEYNTCRYRPLTLREFASQKR